MKKIHILFIMFLIVKLSFSQTYLLTAALNGTTNITCKGDITNTVCNYGSVASPLYYYCQGIDRWQAFSNGGSGPIRINLTYLSLNTGDFVRIYQGVGTGGTLLASYTNTVTTIGNFATSSTGIITVRFTTNSDNAVGDGFDAIIGCQPVGCNGNNPAGDSCSTATRICDISPYCGNTGGWYTDGAEGIDAADGSGLFCGSIENNSWIVFTANTPNPSFQVDVAACTSTASGIQMQMLSSANCSTYTSVSACVSQSATATSFTLNSNVALTPGTSYYLMVDGYAGNYCSYTVTPLVGVQVPTITIPSPTICSGQTTTITINGATSGSTYSWTASSPGTISGSTTNSLITISPTSNIIYSVSVNQPNGCATNIYTQSVTVNTVPTIAANNATNCAGLTVTLTASGATNYSWNTGATTATIAASPTTTTIYTVTGTTNGCSNTQTVNIAVNSTPTTTASTTGTLACSPTTVALNSTLAGINYTWTAPAGGSLGAANSQSTSASGAPGTYTLFVQNASGCTYSTTTNVTQNIAPPTGVSAGSNQTLTCATPSLTLNGSVTTPTNTTVNWTGPNICGSSTNYTTSACGAGVYTLTVTNPANNCSVTSTVQIFPSAGAPVVTANPVTNSITCTNSIVTIGVTTTVTPVTYTWSGTGISSGNGTGTITVTQGGAFIYSVTAGGCTTSGNISVTTNTTAPNTVANVTGTVTCVTSTINLNSSLGGMSYTWTAPAGSSISSSVNTQNAIGSGSGTYSLTIVDPSNGCSYNTTASAAQNTVAPTLTLSPLSFTTSCSSTTVQLTATSTNTNVTYTWANTGGSLNNNSISNPIANGSGMYNVVVTNTINGCSASQTSSITSPSGAPSLTISSSALTLDCNNTSQSVTVTSTPNTDIVYNWNVTPFSASIDSSQATFTTPNTYICTVTNTISNCSSSIQVAITSNTVIPTIAISGTQTLTCSSPSVTINTTVTPVSSYTWSGSGIVSGQNTGAIVVNASDTYTVNVTSSVNGCTNTATSTIVSNTTIPSATINATSSNSIITCLNTSVTLSVNVTPIAGYTYTWSTSSNSTSINAQTAGTYSVLVYNSSSGCTTTAQYTVFSNTIAPNISTTNTVIPCGSNTVNVVSTSTDVVTYNWSTSNGSIITNSATAVVGSAGIYTVTVTNAANGCTNTAIANVSQTNVTALFTANPLSGTAPLPVNFTNQSTGATGYAWTFGDTNNNTAVITDPSHTYSTTGTYTVILTAMSGACTNSYSVIIDVFASSTVVIPNVFTPNGDGLNDVFKITANGVKDLTCDIFNRWGAKIYTISAVNDSWDGSGSVDGTYFYVLRATGYDGKEFNEKGFISLFK